MANEQLNFVMETENVPYQLKRSIIIIIIIIIYIIINNKIHVQTNTESVQCLSMK